VLIKRGQPVSSISVLIDYFVKRVICTQTFSSFARKIILVLCIFVFLYPVLLALLILPMSALLLLCDFTDTCNTCEI